YLVDHLVLAEVDLALADETQQGAEDPVGRGVVLSEVGAGAPAQELVHLRRICAADPRGGPREREDFVDFVLTESRWRPAGAAAGGAVDQRADDTAVGPLVE